MYGGATNTRALQFNHQGLPNRMNGRLACRISAHIGPGKPGTYTAQKHHAARSFPQKGQGIFGCKGKPGNIYRQLAFPFNCFKVFQFSHYAKSGVGNGHIYPAPFFYNGIHAGFYACILCYIAKKGGGFAPRSMDFGNKLLKFVHSAGRSRYHSTFTGKSQRKLATNTGGCTGYPNYFFTKFHYSKIIYKRES